MSLSIDPREVTAVLLADGWHDVEEGTFEIDAYELFIRYWNGEEKIDQSHMGGQSDICASGFQFVEDGWKSCGVVIGGPFSSVIALRYRVLSTDQKMRKYPDDWDGHPKFGKAKKASTALSSPR